MEVAHVFVSMRNASEPLVGGTHKKKKKDYCDYFRRRTRRSHSRIEPGRCIADTLHRHLFGSPRGRAAPRRYKVSYGCHHRHEHYHEATIITVARLTVINHATGMIRLNCCSHVSALEALPCRSLHGRKSDAGRGTDGGGRRGREEGDQRRGEGARPFPTTWTTRTGSGERGNVRHER